MSNFKIRDTNMTGYLNYNRASEGDAIGPRFDPSFRHFLLLRSVVILSRWADVGCQIFPSLITHTKKSSQIHLEIDFNCERKPHG